MISLNSIKTNLPYIFIPTLNANFLIDTGSSKSLIDPALAHKFYRRFIYKEKFHIQTAHNVSYHDEVCEIPIFKIFNVKDSHKFYIFKFNDNYEGLIGADLLKQLKATINLESKVLATPFTEIPIIYETENKNVKQTQSNAKKIPIIKINIPGRTEKVVKLPVKMQSGSGILNYLKFSDGIETPKALVNVENNFAITTIVNSTEKSVNLNIFEAIDIEPLNLLEINCMEKMEIDNDFSITQDNVLKQNLKNIRLDHCNKEEREAIRKLCFDYRDIFYCDKLPLSFTNSITHKIKLSDETPIHTKSYRFPEVHKAEVRKQINSMLEQGIIQHSTSPWSSPIWIVPKKLDQSGKRKWRIVIDYRKLNEKTISDKYPLPNICDILDKLGKANYFTTLDLASGFHQIEVDKNDIPKTAFSAENGLYEFRRMPFGLKNAPSTFQRVMDNVLRGLSNETCLVYLDDIIIFSTSLQEHIDRLKNVFDRLRKSNFKVQLDKSEFLQKSVAYLGHIITPDGVKPNPDKIRAIQNFPIPNTPKEIKSFLGLLGYYRRFIKDFAKITKPLTSCLKKNAKIIHDAKFLDSFETCKKILCNDPVLQYPDFSKPFILTTDASNFALGAVLSQGTPPNDRPVAYASRTLNDSETRYSTIEKELLAIVWGCKYFRPYLFGRKFTIYTDHRPLAWLFSLKDPNSKLIRWRLKLEEYDYDIIYKKGRLNTNADALSRIQLNALETASIDNNPGDVDENVLELLRQMAENPIDRQQTQNFDPPKINIISDIQIMPPKSELEDSNSQTQNSISDLETPHSCSNETSQNAIPILDEIINNKFNQIIVEPNVHQNLKVQQKTKDKYKIINVSIPKFNYDLTLQFLKEYVTPGKTTFIYFCDMDLYKTFNDVYMNYFTKHTKLLACNKRVNTIEDFDEQILLMRNYHEGKSNHRGITETLEKLKRNYFWPRMKESLTEFINNCDICQKAKYCRKKPESPLVLTQTPTKPFEILHIDVFSINKEQYLTIIDKFSKLGQAIKLYGADTVEICDKLLEYFSYYGTPSQIVADNAKNFNSEAIKEILKLHKVNIHFTTPYHHESNSPVERFHSSLIEHLRILQNLHKNERNLMRYAIIAYNSSIHSDTKFTPYELVLGHTSNGDPSNFITDTFYSEYANTHKEKLSHLYSKISEQSKLNKENRLQKREDQNINNHNFKVNDIVYKYDNKSNRNKSKNKFIGPFTIIELLEHNKVKIKHNITSKTSISHVQELKAMHNIHNPRLRSSETDSHIVN